MHNLIYLVFLTMLSIIPSTPLYAQTSAQTPLHIYFLDVGQGDAMLLHQAGEHALLIDAGPLISGARITAALEQLAITELDSVIITHPHLDHFGGLFHLNSRIDIKTFYDNGRFNPAKEYFRDYEAIREQQEYRVIAAGEVFRYGELAIEVLHPPQTDPVGQVWNLNGSSLALLITFHDFTLLQMGDLSGPAEFFFLLNNPDVTAHVLKVAHHGAEDGTSRRLLEQIQPELAVISVSPDNWINAPSQKVLSRLDDMNIDYVRTDQFGTVKLTIIPGNPPTLEKAEFP